MKAKPCKSKLVNLSTSTLKVCKYVLCCSTYVQVVHHTTISPILFKESINTEIIVGPFSLKFTGKFNWFLPWEDVSQYVCDDGRKYQEGQLKIVASLTDHSNGEVVSGHATARVTTKDLNMGFSVPTPTIFYHDMPYHAWVSRHTTNTRLRSIFIYIFSPTRYGFRGAMESL